MQQAIPIIAVAPMMDWTDRHDRFLLRLIAPDIRLYTEMVTTGALLHGDRDYLLGFDPAEKYLALQLGGSDPQDLALCAKMGADAGYDEINLNVGCPSPRVQKGRFGACLMQEPALVADCVAAMGSAVNIPVTVKCRLGVDDHDSDEFLYNFIETVAAGGCDTFILHARKAWLKGLSPKQNREIPPLQYERVRRLKKDFPQYTILLNGGLQTVDQVAAELPFVDGVMIGRAAYHNPYLLAELQAAFFPTRKILSRQEVVLAFIPYLDQQLAGRSKFISIARHLLGMFNGLPGANKWRRTISEAGVQANASSCVLKRALEQIQSS